MLHARVCLASNTHDHKVGVDEAKSGQDPADLDESHLIHKTEYRYDVRENWESRRNSEGAMIDLRYFDEVAISHAKAHLDGVSAISSRPDVTLFALEGFVIQQE